MKYDQNNAVIFCHRAVRNHRLLPSLALAEERGNRVTADPGGHRAGAVCLAVNAPSGGQWSRLCRLRRGLCLHRAAMVTRGRWGKTQRLRLGRGPDCPVRHADHRGGLGARLSALIL